MRSQRYMVLLTCLTAAVGLVTNVATGQLPRWLGPYLWLSWLVLGMCILLLIIVTLRQGHDGTPVGHQQPKTSSLVADKKTEAVSVMPPAECQHQQEILALKQRRLQALEKQAAVYSLNCPPEVTMQIEDLQREIKTLNP